MSRSRRLTAPSAPWTPADAELDFDVAGKGDPHHLHERTDDCDTALMDSASPIRQQGGMIGLEVIFVHMADFGRTFFKSYSLSNIWGSGQGEQELVNLCCLSVARKTHEGRGVDVQHGTSNAQDTCKH